MAIDRGPSTQGPQPFPEHLEIGPDGDVTLTPIDTGSERCSVGDPGPGRHVCLQRGVTEPHAFAHVSLVIGGAAESERHRHVRGSMEGDVDARDDALEWIEKMG